MNDFLPIFPHFQTGLEAIKYRRSPHNSAEYLLSSMKFPQNHDSISTPSQALVPTLTHSLPLFHTYDTGKTAPQESHHLYLHKHMYSICKTCYIISTFFPHKCYVYYNFFFLCLNNTHVLHKECIKF